jgi:hypothetical protein
MPLVEREALVRQRLLAPDGLTGQDATFDRAAITKATYQAATGLLDAAEARGFLERFLAGPDLVPLATPQGQRFTPRSSSSRNARLSMGPVSRPRRGCWPPARRCWRRPPSIPP